MTKPIDFGGCVRDLMLCVLFSTFVSNAYSLTVAICGKGEGYSNYHYRGSVGKSASGLTKDKVSYYGTFEIQKQRDGVFDLVFMAGPVKISSVLKDGGKVTLLKRGIGDATFLVLHTSGIVELYKIWTNSDGGAEFDLMQTKGIDSPGFSRSSLFTGMCSQFDTSALRD